ncbi:hypothetical protein [Sinorhizobium meliloti]|uniref:hypothetical protein n=1 Tax=Rhizobium meliloti TaxID=382 RepID=UPI0013E40C45|nr:hypothetical protein [Sinorhizobium meliloti]
MSKLRTAGTFAAIIADIDTDEARFSMAVTVKVSAALALPNSTSKGSAVFAQTNPIRQDSSLPVALRNSAIFRSNSAREAIAFAGAFAGTEGAFVVVSQFFITSILSGI